jgi:hypothetical protein
MRSFNSMVRRLAGAAVIVTASWVGLCDGAASKDTLRPFSVDLTITKRGSSQTGRIYSDGQSIRINLNADSSGADRLIFIRIYDDKKQVVSSRDKTYIENPYGIPGDEDFVRYLPGAMVESILNRIETIDGNVCEKYIVKTVYKSHVYQSLEWRVKALGGFVVKRKGLDDSWITEYKNVQLGAQPAELFDIPPGYKGTLFSQDWEPVMPALYGMGGSPIDAAKKAGLRVEIENESNGDQFVEYLDPVTGNSVMMQHIIVESFPLPPANLQPPVLLSPANGTVFDFCPRKTELRWQPVTGAASYVVQVDIQLISGSESPYWASERGIGYKQETTTETVFQFEFAGAQSGRWRVWAVDAQGEEGPKSTWYTFRYTK